MFWLLHKKAKVNWKNQIVAAEPLCYIILIFVGITV